MAKPNKLHFISFTDFKKEAFKDPLLKAEYDALEPEFAIIDSLIRKRLEKKISQKQLARRMGTQQSALSRLESGTYNPSLRFLKKVAAALDSRLQISIV